MCEIVNNYPPSSLDVLYLITRVTFDVLMCVDVRACVWPLSFLSVCVSCSPYLFWFLCSVKASDNKTTTTVYDVSVYFFCLFRFRFITENILKLFLPRVCFFLFDFDLLFNCKFRFTFAMPTSFKCDFICFSIVCLILFVLSTEKKHCQKG